LSKTSSVTDQQSPTNWVTGASVVIQSDMNETETLIEKTPGNYHTNSIQGVVGRTYWITIASPDGSKFQSSQEMLLPVGELTALWTEFQFSESPYTPPQIKYPDDAPYNNYKYDRSSNGFDIYLNAAVLPEQEGRALWRWSGTYEVVTFPELHTTSVALQDRIVYYPSPIPCSGWITRDAQHIDLVAPCTCCSCWVNEYNQVPIISNPKFINNGTINGLHLAFIEANIRTFYKRYHLEVEQLSVSKVVYDFWNNVKIQKQNSSTLFQVPPPKTSGNIVSEVENNFSVIGYFSASSIKKKSVFIDQTDIPYKVLPIDTVTMDCRKAFKNASTVKPLFW
jgi:hypothetical protein